MRTKKEHVKSHRTCDLSLACPKCAILTMQNEAMSFFIAPDTFDQFEDDAEVAADSVVVKMLWNDGVREGIVLVPPPVLSLMADFNIPMAGDRMALENAVSFAVFIAMKARIKLVLSGDATVWDETWGRLVKGRPASSFVTH